MSSLPLAKDLYDLQNNPLPCRAQRHKLPLLDSKNVQGPIDFQVKPVQLK